MFLFDHKYDRVRNAYDPKFRGICDLYNRSLENMLRIIDEETCRTTRTQLDHERQQSYLHLEAIHRVLKRESPEYLE